MKNKHAGRPVEIEKRLRYKCSHGHTGLEHPNCYEKDSNIEESVLLFDIEAEDLNADYGIMFCWCAMDLKTGKMYQDVLTLDDIKKFSVHHREDIPKEDKRIVESLVNLLSKYDRCVGHYSSRYDIPMVRSRAVMCGIPFPKYGMMNQTDTWIILKNKFKLSRNSLQNSTLKLLGKTRKDHLSLAIKHGCLRGEKWALDLSLKHCQKDVLDLRDLFLKIRDYSRTTRTSV